MSKRIFVRIISFFTALMLILCGFLIKLFSELRFFKDRVKYTYSQSLGELEESIDNISLNLQKAEYVTTEKQMSEISSLLFEESKSAKASFARFPSSDKQAEKLNKFLSQVGNYAVYLSGKMSVGEKPDEAEYQNLESLRKTADKVSENIKNAHSSYETNGQINIELDNLKLSDDNFLFSDMEDELSDYPTLIYDGPYSDYISLKKSPMLQSSKDISQEQAAKKLSELFNISTDKIKFESYEAGTIAAYQFTFADASAAVTQKGGYLSYYRKYTKEQKAVYTAEQARNKAAEIISSITNENFIPTYHFTDKGVCVINFACKSGGAICYADLIKVGIDLHSGDMVLYESRGYLTNHTNRETVKPKYTVDKAKEVLSKKLTVKSSALAIIPTSGGYEKLCWEFVCQTNQKHNVIVYINAENLREEQIFIVLDTLGGTLVK